MASILGGVGALGDGLDKATGGRAIRGTLAGKPRELMSVIPFSDTLGLTNAKDMTRGRDLTDAYGLTTKGNNSFGSHAAGFLADTALSPLSWLGAGAAFKAAPTVGKGLIGAGKALSGLDLIDGIKSGAKGLKNFGSKLLHDESGALHLPFDNTKTLPPGLSRSDPEWINNRTWYHGDQTPQSLPPSDFDLSLSGPKNSLGRGYYSTGDPAYASQYTHHPGMVREFQPNVKRIVDLEGMGHYAPDFAHAMADGAEGWANAASDFLGQPSLRDELIKKFRPRDFKDAANWEDMPINVAYYDLLAKREAMFSKYPELQKMTVDPIAEQIKRWGIDGLMKTESPGLKEFRPSYPHQHQATDARAALNQVLMLLDPSRTVAASRVLQ